MAVPSYATKYPSLAVVQVLLAVHKPHPVWHATTQLFELVTQVAQILWLQASKKLNFLFYSLFILPIVPPEMR